MKIVITILKAITLCLRLTFCLLTDCPFISWGASIEDVFAIIYGLLATHFFKGFQCPTPVWSRNHTAMLIVGIHQQPSIHSMYTQVKNAYLTEWISKANIIGSLFITIYMSHMWPNYSSVVPAVSSYSSRRKVRSRLPENFTHTIFLSQQHRTCFLLFSCFWIQFLPRYLSMSVAPQCKEEILRKKYDCGASKDERASAGLSAFPLGHGYYYTNSLQVDIKSPFHGWSTLHLQTLNTFKKGMFKRFQNIVNKCRSLHLTIFKKITWSSRSPISLPNFQNYFSWLLSNKELKRYPLVLVFGCEKQGIILYASQYLKMEICKYVVSIRKSFNSKIQFHSKEHVVV